MKNFLSHTTATINPVILLLIASVKIIMIVSSVSIDARLLKGAGGIKSGKGGKSSKWPKIKSTKAPKSKNNKTKKSTKYPKKSAKISSDQPTMSPTTDPCVTEVDNGVYSVKMEIDCWTQLQNACGAPGCNCQDLDGNIEFSGGEMTSWGSGYRLGNFVFPAYNQKIIKFDFIRGSHALVKWKAVKSSDCGYSYAVFNPSLRWIDPDTSNDEVFGCGSDQTNLVTIAPVPNHTTNHSYDTSTFIAFDTWYYTTISIYNQMPTTQAVTCKNDYGCTNIDTEDFVSEIFGETPPSARLTGTLFMGIFDNYCGKDIGVTTAEFITTGELV